MKRDRKLSMVSAKLRRLIGNHFQWVFLGTLIFLLCSERAMSAEEAESSGGILGAIDSTFQGIVDFLSPIVFVKIGGENGFPLIVLWLIFAAAYFTIRLGFPNIRFFKHAIDVVRGKYDDPNEPGEVSHFQALATALSGTVGLGNIAGVAIAIQLGGPGASLWMTLGGFLGMTSKFVECGLATKYRRVNPDGTVEGGPMYYLKKGFGDRGMRPLGNFLSAFFAIMVVIGSFGIGNLFQSNQAYAATAQLIPAFPSWLFGLLIAAIVGLVIIGGITRIASITEKLTPGMAVLYALGCIIILLVNFPQIPAAIATIVTSAFAPQAVAGGVVGTIIQGIRRSTFSNEAGLGSAAIAHSAVKTDEPLREGIVALLEPFIDTILICNLTALAIVVTGAHTAAGEGVSGVEITAAAFGTIAGWFPIVLTLCVILFGISTLISWSYYGEQGWIYLFGRNSLLFYRGVYIACAFLGAIVSIGAVIDFSDMMVLIMAIPNLLGCYLLSNEVAADMNNYLDRLNSGQMPTYEHQSST